MMDKEPSLWFSPASVSFIKAMEIRDPKWRGVVRHGLPSVPHPYYVNGKKEVLSYFFPRATFVRILDKDRVDITTNVDPTARMLIPQGSATPVIEYLRGISRKI